MACLRPKYQGLTEKQKRQLDQLTAAFESAIMVPKDEFIGKKTALPMNDVGNAFHDMVHRYAEEWFNECAQEDLSNTSIDAPRLNEVNFYWNVAFYAGIFLSECGLASVILNGKGG